MSKMYAEARLDNAPIVPQINVFCENADEKAIEDMKTELQNVLDTNRAQSEWANNLTLMSDGNIIEPDGHIVGHLYQGLKYAKYDADEVTDKYGVKNING